jgi:hypothetical protein
MGTHKDTRSTHSGYSKHSHWPHSATSRAFSATSAACAAASAEISAVRFAFCAARAPVDAAHLQRPAEYSKWVLGLLTQSTLSTHAMERSDKSHEQVARHAGVLGVPAISSRSTHSRALTRGALSAHKECSECSQGVL